ncbi:MAG: TAXI family TRAP transporter solute-binding subunit [Candidatus Tectomicrobia bacterium]|nr:TAXI family TRAP transporter solute-binding subunit [Candidatus Tectomicrobia bacterium]
MKVFCARRALRWICALLLLVPVAAPPGRAAAEDWIFLTGSMGGSWYPLGAVMVDLLNKGPSGIRFSQKPGSSIANLQQVGTGKAQVAFALGNLTAVAMKGGGQFKGKSLPNIRNLGTLTLNYFTLIATSGSGIRRVEDLRGKRYIPMPRGNSGERLAETLLKAHGLKYQDIGKLHFVGPNDGVALIKDGHADAISSVTVIPLAAYTDLANAREVRVIGLAPQKVQAVLEANPGLIALTIPGGTYHGQPDAVETLGSFVHLITNADLPAEKVYAVTRTLAENAERLGQVHSAYRGLNLRVMATKTPIPFHPGAEKYYRERGAL